jgi:glucosamine-phosphate N-acetyltransferase
MEREIVLRSIEPLDYYKYYLILLSHLTDQDENITYEKFTDFVINLNHPHHQILVIEENHRIIGTITMILEEKLIHQGSKVMHLEDIIVHRDFQGLGLGKKMVQYAIKLAKEYKCYKVICNCSQENIGFYESNGFTKKGHEMSLYFND